jgi:membrane protease subunit HflC
MNQKLIIPIAVAVVIVILIGASLFTVQETEQAIITQLGKFVRTVNEPGLHFKAPFLQSVHKFENRILEYDATVATITTSDKKHLVLDNYARWRIVDPLKFYQAVRSESGAQARLDDIVFSEIREELARHTITEIILKQRAAVMDKVAEQCDLKVREYGIEIIDVRIKRADLPDDIAGSVYERMRAERERIAKKYRSEGQESAVKIMATTDKEKVILLAESYRKAEKLKGEGDAEAIRIYAEAFQQDSEFYTFVRTLEAYEKSLGSDTTIILPSNSEFFQYLSPETK